MGIQSFKKIGLDDTALAKLQENVDNALKPIFNAQIIDGVLLRSVQLVSGVPNKVVHKLGRAPLGYIVVQKNSNSAIWDSQEGNELKNSTLVLNCSTDVKVSLWVF